MRSILFSAIFMLSMAFMPSANAQTTCASNDPSSPVGIVPTQEDFPGGEPKCGGKRLDPGDGAKTIVFNLDGITGNDVTVKITVGDCGEVMEWSVPDHIVIDKVYAKGGTDQNVYDYTGINPRPNTDGKLHSPTNASGNYAAFSHIDFCFHYRLNASKTAIPTYTRTFAWDIKKSCLGAPSLLLATGQTFSYPFSWTATATPTDNNFQVSGTIKVENNTPFAATITGIADVLSGDIPANVNCGVIFPYTLEAGASLNCTYSGDLTGAVDGINTVTVTTSTNEVEGDIATAAYDFGDPTTLIDECIEVKDDCSTASTQVCFSASPYTKNYNCPIGPYTVCKDYTYTNTASFVTNDQHLTGSSSCNVSVSVPCQTGCTLTLGYWKTHSKAGPAPYDDAWKNLATTEEQTFFFKSNATWLSTFNTPPAGNAYYNLAHQYMAAQLNILNGAATTPEVVAAIAGAEALFNAQGIGDVTLTRVERSAALSYASTLDKYNNGLIGPGHCSEEVSGSSSPVSSAAQSVENRLMENALSQLPSNLLKAWPNPTKTGFNLRVDINNSNSPVFLKVFDMTGRQVYSTSGATNRNFTFGEKFTPGIYLVEINHNDSRSTLRLIKQ